MALSITLPSSRTFRATAASAVDVVIVTGSKHYVWVIWSSGTPIASEANVPQLQLNLPAGTYRLVLTFNGPQGTQAEIKVTSNGVTKVRKGSIGQNGSTGQLTRQFSV